MEKSCMFLRGQIWYWEDPIYSKKEEGEMVRIGEATIRFSRYVIVAQNTNTIGKGSIAVIPCSSNNSIPHDIAVPLSHLFYENHTYAKVQSIFPVHPKFLQRYICTLSDGIMKKIEAELIKLFIPTLCDDYPRGELEKYGLDLASVDAHPLEDITQNDRCLEKHIKDFMIKHLTKSDNVEDFISVQDMKEAFDNYCIEMKVPSVTDLIEFLDGFHRVYHPYVKSNTSHCIYTIIGWECLKFKGIPTATSEIPDLDEKAWKDKTWKEKVWTEENILKFLELYQDLGAGGVADEFGIKESSAVQYWYRWKSKIDKLRENICSNFSIPLPSSEYICPSISKVANIIRETLHESFIYDEMKGYWRDPRSIMLPEEFYNKIGNVIYYSLLEFLNIKKENGSKEFTVPEINMETPFLGTWYFFDKVYQDKRISYEKKGLRYMNAYLKYYGDMQKGIDRRWLEIFKTKLSHKFNIIDTGLQVICDSVGNLFCTPKIV